MLAMLLENQEEVKDALLYNYYFIFSYLGIVLKLFKKSPEWECVNLSSSSSASAPPRDGPVFSGGSHILSLSRMILYATVR